jgi:hypothetical protein
LGYILLNWYLLIYLCIFNKTWPRGIRQSSTR